jgi:hypothetical protein
MRPPSDLGMIGLMAVAGALAAAIIAFTVLALMGIGP